MKTKHGQNSPERRMTARFDGHVQGIGFRYTTAHLAAEFGVRGFVQNEMDGAVTVVAEGPEAVLLALVCRVKSSHLGHYILNESISWSPPTGEFGDFSVRYGALCSRPLRKAL
jgi:acylphosphatase